jgi:capsular polysaccharide biosynthesis protein
VFPNFKLVMAAGVLASLMLALAVVVAKDLLSNRILEPWQIERQLGLPVLGTLRSA